MRPASSHKPAATSQQPQASSHKPAARQSPALVQSVYLAHPDFEAKVMSAIPHASGLPTPSPSQSSTRIKKGVFPPRPKSVRIWAVLNPAAEPSQPEPVPSTPGKQSGHTGFSGNPNASMPGQSLISAWRVLGVLGVFLALVLAVLLGKYLGK